MCICIICVFLTRFLLFDDYYDDKVELKMSCKCFFFITYIQIIFYSYFYLNKVLRSFFISTIFEQERKKYIYIEM